MSDSPTILVVGGGKMGGGLIRAWLNRRLVAAANISVVEPAAPAAGALEALGVAVYPTFGEAPAKGADAVVWAVKPQVIRATVKQAAAALKDRLAISVAAGVSLAQLRTAAPGARWIRVMPNQPSVVGVGAAAMLAGDGVTGADRDLAAALFDAVGMARWVADEDAMHAVTGLSGSGPAFVAVFAEAMEDAGVRAGLTRELARDLALQTIAGAAAQIRDLNWQPSDLKNAVTSPGGTTIAGVDALEAHGLRAAVAAAVAAATERSRELSEDK